MEDTREQAARETVKELREAKEQSDVCVRGRKGGNSRRNTRFKEVF